jgi:hypothetical protein
VTAASDKTPSVERARRHRRSRPFSIRRSKIPVVGVGWARAADFRARRDDEPAADLGSGADPARQDVRRRRRRWAGSMCNSSIFAAFPSARRRGSSPAGKGLADLMSGIDCRGGHTQIRKVLAHVRSETQRARVGAFVFVGDAMEENVDELAQIGRRTRPARRQGLPVSRGRRRGSGAGVPGHFARLTGGAYAAFDAAAPKRLGGIAGGGRRLCRGRTARAGKTGARGQARGAESAITDAVTPRATHAVCHFRTSGISARCASR